MARTRDTRPGPRTSIAHSLGSENVVHVETDYAPERFIRCPFAMAALRGVDMSLCVGYQAEVISVAVEDPDPLASACAHLESAPHPSRDAMVGVCRHPEAPWIVATARRVLEHGDLGASAIPMLIPTGKVGTPLALAARVRGAQLRAALLVGRTRVNLLCSRAMRASTAWPNPAT